jgi:hypothetical protein
MAAVEQERYEIVHRHTDDYSSSLKQLIEYLNKGIHYNKILFKYINSNGGTLVQNGIFNNGFGFGADFKDTDNLFKFIINKLPVAIFDICFIQNISSNLLDKLRQTNFYENLIYKIVNDYYHCKDGKDIMKLIIDNYKDIKYDFNFKYDNGQTFFHVICHLNNFEYIEKIVENKDEYPELDLNVKDKDGNTAYDLAGTYFGNKSRIMTFLDLHSDKVETKHSNLIKTHRNLIKKHINLNTEITNLKEQIIELTTKRKLESSTIIVDTLVNVKEPSNKKQKKK